MNRLRRHQAKPTITTTPAASGLLQRQCACGQHIAAGGECAECSKKRLSLQRKLANYSEATAVPPIVHEVLRTPGRPLDPATRTLMEPRFGQNFSRVPATAPQRMPDALIVRPATDYYEQEADKAADRVMRASRVGTIPAAPHVQYDFSQVRIHTDAQAGESARAVNALAYTVGRDVVFRAGQYAPETTAGQRLLAHELTHVVQQSASDMLMVQRQINIPIFDEFDPCIITPQGKLCGSDAKTACEKIPSIPGCSAICKALGCKKPEKRKPLCPPGFQPGTAKGFEGLCCQGSVHNEKNCCLPNRIAFNSSGASCCKEDEVVSNGECVKSSSSPPFQFCPPERLTPSGQCCTPPMISDGVKCVFPTTPSVKPPPPTPGSTIVDTKQIGFNKDAPQSWFNPSSSYAVSVTGVSKQAFDQIVDQMKKQPALRVRLEGHASIEKPASDPAYNQRLTDRRASLIAAELQKRGIDATRIANPPGQSVPAGCVQLKPGVHSCGDVGAQSAPSQDDRNVTVQVFSVIP